LSRHVFKKVADIYIVVSTSLLHLLYSLGIPKTKIRVVPNGVDAKRFHPNNKIRMENLILFVGRLVPKKGLLVLLNSLKLLKTPVRLAIIGPPPWPPNPKYFHEILKLVKRINEETFHRVEYLGVLEKEEIIKWYQKASVFICPSFSEPFGIVNLEALACETPVIASNVGGIPDVVTDHKNGILVPPNDVVRFAQAIQYLLDNERTRRKFGKEGRRLVSEFFSNEVVVKRLCEIYSEIMSN